MAPAGRAQALTLVLVLSWFLSCSASFSSCKSCIHRQSETTEEQSMADVLSLVSDLETKVVGESGLERLTEDMELLQGIMAEPKTTCDWFETFAKENGFHNRPEHARFKTFCKKALRAAMIYSVEKPCEEFIRSIFDVKGAIEEYIAEAKKKAEKKAKKKALEALEATTGKSTSETDMKDTTDKDGSPDSTPSPNPTTRRAPIDTKTDFDTDKPGERPFAEAPEKDDESRVGKPAKDERIRDETERMRNEYDMLLEEESTHENSLEDEGSDSSLELGTARADAGKNADVMEQGTPGDRLQDEGTLEDEPNLLELYTKGVTAILAAWQDGDKGCLRVEEKKVQEVIEAQAQKEERGKVLSDCRKESHKPTETPGPHVSRSFPATMFSRFLASGNEEDAMTGWCSVIREKDDATRLSFVRQRCDQECSHQSLLGAFMQEKVPALKGFHEQCAFWREIDPMATCMGCMAAEVAEKRVAPQWNEKEDRNPNKGEGPYLKDGTFNEAWTASYNSASELSKTRKVTKRTMCAINCCKPIIELQSQDSLPHGKTFPKTPAFSISKNQCTTWRKAIFVYREETYRNMKMSDFAPPAIKSLSEDEVEVYELVVRFFDPFSRKGKFALLARSLNSIVNEMSGGVCQEEVEDVEGWFSYLEINDYYPSVENMCRPPSPSATQHTTDPICPENGLYMYEDLAKYVRERVSDGHAAQPLENRGHAGYEYCKELVNSSIILVESMMKSLGEVDKETYLSTAQMTFFDISQTLNHYQIYLPYAQNFWMVKDLGARKNPDDAADIQKLDADLLGPFFRNVVETYRCQLVSLSQKTAIVASVYLNAWKSKEKTDADELRHNERTVFWKEEEAKFKEHTEVNERNLKKLFAGIDARKLRTTEDLSNTPPPHATIDAESDSAGKTESGSSSEIDV